jgi:hypothetical protein
MTRLHKTSRVVDGGRVGFGWAGWVRNLTVLAGLLLLGMALGGCEEICEECHHRDWQAPARPQGLWSSTGDREVELHWYANTEADLCGYRIYRSTEAAGYFPRIATIGPHLSDFVDTDVRNGVTYYYAISAFDNSGNESELSSDEVFDTPRPAGQGLRLNNAQLHAGGSGYDFSAERAVDYHDLEADVYYWRTEEDGAWMVATERSADEYTDIQDAGYLPLDRIDFAPEDGWAPAGEVPLIVGHSYIVWTWDNHYAKFRVVDLDPERVVLDWAYQIDRGNPELIRPGALKARHRPSGGTRKHEQGMERRIAS